MRPTHRGHLRKFLMAHLQGNLAGIFRFKSASPGGELQQQSSEPCLRPAKREHLGASLRFSEPNTHADHEGQECTLMCHEILKKVIQHNLDNRALSNSVRGRMPQTPCHRTTAEFPERVLRLYEL
jgi:hypothetical protein